MKTAKGPSVIEKYSIPSQNYKLLSKHRACFSYSKSTGYTTKQQTWEIKTIFCLLKLKEKHLTLIQ